MHIQEISKEKAIVWFSRDELRFMIAAAERALMEMDPDEFDTRTGRTIGYANAILAQLRVANGEISPRNMPHQADDQVFDSSRDPNTRRLRVTIRVELVRDDKALVSLSDYELSFLNNAINEAIHGLHGVEEFERSSGKTSEYGRRLMHQLIAAKDRTRAFN
ncbi:hypothetical protein [Reyranella sp.]|uniref:hypothetical protein n=1 Tax=Reyranella sp. TaxID=1929291 RepID=UPI003D14A5F8